MLLVTQKGDEAALLRGIDLGVNDYISRPIEPCELKARTRTQVKAQAFERSSAGESSTDHGDGCQGFADRTEQPPLF